MSLSEHRIEKAVDLLNDYAAGFVFGDYDNGSYVEFDKATVNGTQVSLQFEVLYTDPTGLDQYLEYLVANAVNSTVDPGDGEIPLSALTDQYADTFILTYDYANKQDPLTLDFYAGSGWLLS
jgi:hypothetical protein